MGIDNKAFLDDFDLLTQHGVVGMFDHFEVTSLVVFENTSTQPTNIFTIVTAIENGKTENLKKLNDERIELKGVKNKSFGVFKSVQSVSLFRAVLVEYFDDQVWKQDEKVVSVGGLKPLIKQFIPPDASTKVPLNQVLKNNFFNGSYVLELGDLDKHLLSEFFDASATLQEFSEIVSNFVPIKIASLADRLGNITIQFPVEVIRANFQSNGSNYRAEVAWHPKIPERDLSLMCYTEYDNSIISYGQKQLRSGHVFLGSDPGHGMIFGTVWDETNSILLSATGGLAFINQIVTNMNIIEPEPRTFSERIGGTTPLSRVKLSHRHAPLVVGADHQPSLIDATRKRIYDKEIYELTLQRKFIQYGVRGHSKPEERVAALNDIRALIISHGIHGVYLWDPYLAPQDIIDTLFHNTAFGSPMKALTSLKEHKSQRHKEGSSTKDERLNLHKETLEKLDGNFLGLNIEYRSAHGSKGWKFHDRFLIFPKSSDIPAKAWSLGASINSLGKSHHILQQVDNAQLIVDAFQLLWNAVDQQENLIWLCP